MANPRHGTVTDSARKRPIRCGRRFGCAAPMVDAGEGVAIALEILLLRGGAAAVKAVVGPIASTALHAARLAPAAAAARAGRPARVPLAVAQAGVRSADLRPMHQHGGFSRSLKTFVLLGTALLGIGIQFEIKLRFLELKYIHQAQTPQWPRIIRASTQWPRIILYMKNRILRYCRTNRQTLHMTAFGENYGAERTNY